MAQHYTNLSTIWRQRCFDLNVTFLQVTPFLIEENVLKVKRRLCVLPDEFIINYMFRWFISLVQFQMDFLLLILPEPSVGPNLQQTLLDHCGKSLGISFGLKFPDKTLDIEPLLNISAIGNQCPPIRALTSNVSSGFTCSVGSILNKDANGVSRCRE